MSKEVENYSEDEDGEITHDTCGLKVEFCTCPSVPFFYDKETDTLIDKNGSVDD